MDTLIFLIGVSAIIVANSLAAYALGWLFTEAVTPVLSVKPFNCRPCLSFWLSVLLNFAFAWVVAPYFVRRGLVVDRSVVIYGIACAGILLGLINFLYIKLKFRIYD